MYSWQPRRGDQATIQASIASAFDSPPFQARTPFAHFGVTQAHIFSSHFCESGSCWVAQVGRRLAPPPSVVRTICNLMTVFARYDLVIAFKSHSHSDPVSKVKSARVPSQKHHLGPCILPAANRLLEQFNTAFVIYITRSRRYSVNSEPRSRSALPLGQSAHSGFMWHEVAFWSSLKALIGRNRPIFAAIPQPVQEPAADAGHPPTPCSPFGMPFRCCCCGRQAARSNGAVVDDEPPSTSGGWAGEAAYVAELRRQLSTLGEVATPDWDRMSFVNTSYAGGSLVMAGPATRPASPLPLRQMTFERRASTPGLPPPSGRLASASGARQFDRRAREPL